MWENKINKLYREYVELLGDDLDEWDFKQIAIQDYPHLKLDILAWLKEDL